MPLQMAFGITVRDVRAVLAKQADKIASHSDMSDDAFATKLYYSLSDEEMDDIALAAMDAFWTRSRRLMVHIVRSGKF